MSRDFDNPEEEYRRLLKVIHQYELIAHTSHDPVRKDSARTQLAELGRRCRELEQLFQLSGKPESEPVVEEYHPGAAADRPYLSLSRSLCGSAEEAGDAEMDALDTYLQCFGREFLVLLSERQLKLDFKYSLERDAFYHRYQELFRKMNDYRDEVSHLATGETRSDFRGDLHRRKFRLRRGLFVETSRFFTRVVAFGDDLLADIAGDQLKCLNGKSTVRFDALEGRKHFEGVRVYDALKQTRAFSQEVVDFLGVPDFETQE